MPHAAARFKVTASRAARGIVTIEVRASGKVRGRVPKWGTSCWNQVYDHTDVIGGKGFATVTIQ